MANVPEQYSLPEDQDMAHPQNPVGRLPAEKIKEKINYQYTAGDQGPFRVLVEKIDRNDGNQINKLSLANTLRKMMLFKAHIIDLKNVGKHKIMVYLNNYQLANRLTVEDSLKEKNYRAYIPQHLIAVAGVIADVPLDISEEDFLEGIECEYQIMKVQRLTRWVEEKEKKEPTQRVSVLFRTNKLPDSVKVFHCSMKVRPFFRKTYICLNCLRYNHRTENCKGKRRCQKCSKIHTNIVEYNNCSQGTKCYHCRTDHPTTDVNCPERARQNNIQAILARTNLTSVEVIEQFPTKTQNYYEALVDAAQDPTPQESYASMTAGKFQQKRQESRIVHRKREAEKTNPTLISDQVSMFENKRKDKTEHQQAPFALFNKYRTTEAERFKANLRKIQPGKTISSKDNEPTPSSSKQLRLDDGTHREKFSSFINDMIGKGEINPKSLEILKDNKKQC